MQLTMSRVGVVVVGLAACQPAPHRDPVVPARRVDVSGSAMLEVAPTPRIALVGKLELELLGQGVGKACVTDADDTTYWIGYGDFARLGPDTLTRQAIAAAALDAVSRLADADSILVTSVVTEGKDGKVCACLAGRGVRLTKASEPMESKPAETKPAGTE